MNIVLSNPKEKRAYSKKTEEPVFVGKQIGETVSLDSLGLKGYKAIITGGSDRDGFPMKVSLGGQSRRKLFMKKGVGIRQKRKGERQRKRVRGNIIASDIHQLNLKITEEGSEKLSKLFGKDMNAGEKKEDTEGEEKKEKIQKSNAKQEKGEKTSKKEPEKKQPEKTEHEKKALKKDEKNEGEK